MSVMWSWDREATSRSEPERCKLTIPNKITSLKDCKPFRASRQLKHKSVLFHKIHIYSDSFTPITEMRLNWTLHSLLANKLSRGSLWVRRDMIMCMLIPELTLNATWGSSLAVPHSTGDDTKQRSWCSMSIDNHMFTTLPLTHSLRVTYSVTEDD